MVITPFSSNVGYFFCLSFFWLNCLVGCLLYWCCFFSNDSIFLTCYLCCFSHFKFFVFYIPSVGVFWVLKTVPGKGQCIGERNPGGRRLDRRLGRILAKKYCPSEKVEWKEEWALGGFPWRLDSRIEGIWETNWMWGETLDSDWDLGGLWCRDIRTTPLMQGVRSLSFWHFLGNFLCILIRGLCQGYF